MRLKFSTPKIPLMKHLNLKKVPPILGVMILGWLINLELFKQSVTLGLKAVKQIPRILELNFKKS